MKVVERFRAGQLKKINAKQEQNLHNELLKLHNKICDSDFYIKLKCTILFFILTKTEWTQNNILDTKCHVKYCNFCGGILKSFKFLIKHRVMIISVLLIISHFSSHLFSAQNQTNL